MPQRAEAAPSTDIAIVGRSCRLPGAASVADLWQLLDEGRCTVTTIPADRWGLDRAAHPRIAEPGRTYTWAAGVLDDVWGFDAAAFGISPREAAQMDPQQRLMLELAWEACEDAGLEPSALAGTQTGVFVGASAVDHATLRMLDMSAADAYMMTGNTLSVVSNRISHVFDLNGPSLTIDTACSSSLVALAEAVGHLRSGRVDTAIVGGVSLLLAPQSFIGFAQAAMLSRRGLCQAFSAHADGYVRAEGGVALVLKTRAAALRDGDPIHGLIVAAEVNSDGRTNGISLPSQRSQAQLLRRAYAGLDLDDLAFVEAHGTGTPVGDPIEAGALGEALGRRRGAPLPIGSIKTNIGHLEAASGLAGLLKALLALNHGVLPHSLHCDELNPAIDFDGLNLAVAHASLPLSRDTSRRRLAGVNSFGFGGTNAHVVLAAAPKPDVATIAVAPTCLILSAHSREALTALARDHADRLRDADSAGAAQIAAASAYRRDRLAHRLVVPMGDGGDMAAALARFESGVHGTAVARAAPIAFVFSGNGSQFVGMGRRALERNAAFRARVEDISDRVAARAGWSILDTLISDDPATQLGRSRFAQPLLFALQSAACETLRDLGLVPDIVFGHSVGEIAAAEAAGILTRDAALDIVLARSAHQELAHGRGGMAVLVGTRAAAEAIVGEIPGLAIAAYNSPRAFTLAGDRAAIADLSAAARRHRARIVPLDLAYPFHSAGMAPVEVPLLNDLAGLSLRAGHTPFVSTVTGDILAGAALDAHYWWRNVREPVRFADAVERAMRAGARVFVEIGPQATLLSHIGDTLGARASSVATLAIMGKRDADGDPLVTAVRTSLVRGARVDEGKIFGSGPCPGTIVPLPLMPWQRKPYRLAESADSPGLVRPGAWHPLIGARCADRLEWRATLDIASHPWLADHRVDGRVILPGAAFVEMALAVARDWLCMARARVVDLEIASPLVLSEAGVEILCHLAEETGRLEIASRPRLVATAWQVHVTARILRDAEAAVPSAPAETHGAAIDAASIYAGAARAGLVYGPAFRKLERAFVDGTRIRLDLTGDESDASFGLDPARFDACFHALLPAIADGCETDHMTAFVPVRFGDVILCAPGTTVAGAAIVVTRRDARVLVADFTLFDRHETIVAIVREARFQALRRAPPATPTFIHARHVLAALPTAERGAPRLTLAALRGPSRPPENTKVSADFVLLDGWATSLALGLARDLAPGDEPLDPDALITDGHWPHALRPWLDELVATLGRSGLAVREGRRHRIDRHTALPSPGELLATIAREHPELSAELTAAVATGLAVDAVKRGADLDVVRASMTRAVEALEGASARLQAEADVLAARLRAALPARARGRAIRILLVGRGPLFATARELCEAEQARLTIFEPAHRGREERARDAALIDTIEDLPTAGFDLVIAAGALERRARRPGFCWAIRRAMAPDALFAAIEPAPSFFQLLSFGLEAALGGDVGAVRGTRHWAGTLAAAGLSEVAVEPIAPGADAALLLTGRAAPEHRRRVAAGSAVVVGAGGVASALATLLSDAGLGVANLGEHEPLDRLDGAEPFSIVVFSPRRRARITIAEAIGERCLHLAGLVRGLGARPAILWLVAEETDDIAAALFAFSRTLANEYPALDIRRVGIAGRLAPDRLAARLRDLIVGGDGETDIRIAAEATHVLRFETATPGDLGDAPPAEAARLVIGEGAGLDRLRWAPARRRPPGPGEIEIEVVAAGLNFRDVMFGLGLLPEDILEDGFAGASLGLECAGRIVAVGAGVTAFEPGDRVMGFARECFATHVTTSAALVAPIPAAMRFEAAATIPVACLTAFYGLIEQARLRPGEWVLIHGGAGGVGFAALRIALWRGARVIATAGTPEKRALLRSLGAEHVFDSRSGTFVDGVRQVTGEGVAVALNSLAGEAMSRTLSLLRPFGRFVELGKRDYVADTQLGLRPFRRNLSYFGVDLDQLLRGDPVLARRLMRKVMRLVGEGALTALPHRTFAAAEMGEAFRLMQASGHVGKIVLRPPDPSRITDRPARPAWRAAPEKLHLVTGGLGGFGLATAEWLVGRGARHLLLFGRSGVADATVAAKIDALRARGVRVWTEALDVADRPSLKRLFSRFGRDLPPLAGIVHAAMVLDDALLADLTPEAFARVLRPKTTGAAHLDRLSRKLPLDYFILYSSATTLIGNPGQAAYVAANGYLEGLARRRRRAGLPALAVAWGAIADVGILARAPGTAARLEAQAGVVAMPAQAALDQLGDILAAPGDDPETAVLAPASLAWSTARRHLVVPRAPAYDGLTGDERVAEGQAKIDVGALLASQAPDEARRLVGGLIVEEIARVLRLRREDVPRMSPLAEIGLDSLMAVELAMGLEARFTLDRPLSATASGFSVDELAEHVIAQARGAPGGTRAEAALARHLGPAIEASAAEAAE